MSLCPITIEVPNFGQQPYGEELGMLIWRSRKKKFEARQGWPQSQLEKIWHLSLFLGVCLDVLPLKH